MCTVCLSLPYNALAEIMNELSTFSHDTNPVASCDEEEWGRETRLPPEVLQPGEQCSWRQRFSLLPPVCGCRYWKSSVNLQALQSPNPQSTCADTAQREEPLTFSYAHPWLPYVSRLLKLNLNPFALGLLLLWGKDTKPEDCILVMQQSVLCPPPHLTAAAGGPTSLPDWGEAGCVPSTTGWIFSFLLPHQPAVRWSY